MKNMFTAMLISHFALMKKTGNILLKSINCCLAKLRLSLSAFHGIQCLPHRNGYTQTEELKIKYNLGDETILYLFNGALDYHPNLEAVKNIIEKINPIFIKDNFNYKIIICGKNLPAEMNGLKQYADANIIYAGFVEDINIYFKGADVFINPVNDGGGIKTKLVEALGYNLNAVSTINGAIGIDENICNGKLLICENDDWQRIFRDDERGNIIT